MGRKLEKEGTRSCRDGVNERDDIVETTRNWYSEA